MPVEQFARKSQRANRIIGRVAPRRIGQQREFAGWKEFEEAGLAGILSNVGSPNGNRDDLGAAGENGLARLGEILVLSGANQQPGTVGFAGDH